MVWKFISFLVIIILFGPEWSGKTWNALPDIYLVAARTSPIVKKKKKKKKKKRKKKRKAVVIFRQQEWAWAAGDPARSKPRSRGCCSFVQDRHI